MGARGPVPARSDQRRRRNKSWIDEANGANEAAAPVEPPRAGKGSGTQAWIHYARALGYQVADGTARSQIWAMLDARPPEGDDDWHPLARGWFESLAASAQSRFYQPSDWATARVLAELLSRALRSRKVTASSIERWQSGATELLTTEGARRRMRVELEADEQEAGEEVTSLDDYRRRLGSG
ncbi:MAG TPA: hypothetical protein VGA36_09645 [Nitriliruptorales bacterium]